MVENRCYNCRKALDSNRTCLSDGDCPDFESGASDEEVERVLKKLQKDIPGIKFEMLQVVEGCEPKAIIEREN